MQTHIHPTLQGRADIQEADSILRACVHCGFCTAVCPTYQLLGNELDGPRGRIYLIKNLLEEADMSAAAESHLDRCLTCRACETACPSGVQYGRLLDIGRGLRGPQPGLLKWLLTRFVPRTRLLTLAMIAGIFVRPLLPSLLADKIPRRRYRLVREIRNPNTTSKVVLLRGCAQQAATPQVADALELILERAGVGTVPLAQERCCGALEYHLSEHAGAKRRMQQLIGSMEQALDAGATHIISSASGCGVTIKDYGKIFADDEVYAKRAERVAAHTVDAAEYLSQFELTCEPLRVACHTPCTLQHGQRLPGNLEGLLEGAGFELAPVAEGHLCCGSAGTYSFTQPTLSEQLKTRKVKVLEAGHPEAIVTANVGCQLQIGGGTDVPVVHWLTLVQERLVQIRPKNP